MSDANDDTLIGSDGDDRLYGQEGSDLIRGGDGDDYIDGGANGDTLYGEAGNDRIFADAARAFGDDWVDGGDGDDIISTEDGDDTVYGGNGNDDIDAGANDDYVVGGDGDDYIMGGHGVDTLYGGEGDDSLTLSGGSFPGLVHGDEYADGGCGDDVILGGYCNDTLIGGDGNDRASGSLGDDKVIGGNGDDQLSGDAGDDYIEGGANDDTLDGGPSGTDTLLGGAGDDIIIARGNGDILSGGDGADTIIMVFEDDGGIVLDLSEGTSTSNTFGTITFSSIEHVQGSQSDDEIIGDANANRLEGLKGQDTLVGGDGDDTLSAGIGTGDKLTGGSGADIFVFGSITSAAVVTDFNSDEGDTLDFGKVAANFDALDIRQSGDDTDIYAGGTKVVTIENIAPDDLDSSNFSFLEGDGSLFSPATATTVEASGDDRIDGLLYLRAYDTSDTLTFGFPGDSSVFLAGDYTEGYQQSEPYYFFRQLSDEYQDVARDVFADISRYTNLTVVEVEDTGSTAADLRVSLTGLPVAPAWAYIPSTVASGTASDSWYKNAVVYAYDDRSHQAVSTFYHELGHALGLKHPHSTSGTGVTLPEDQDSKDLTVMSYENSTRYPDASSRDLYPTGFLQYDILALQHLYGVDTETTAGNDTYLFDLSDRYFEALWDYGGTDTIRVYGGDTSVHINLAAGEWTGVGTTINYIGGDPWSNYDSNTLYIMDDTLIENATGANGDDTLTGNDADNVLKGMEGDDIAYGMAGDDTVWAGAGDTGNDQAYGGDGNDLLAGSAGDDLLVGEVDSDTLFGGSGDDVLLTGGFNDTDEDGTFDEGEAGPLSVNSETAWGGAGSDTIVGTNGNETLGGGTGGDVIEAWGGNDIIFGGSSTISGTLDDAINAGAGQDTIFGSSGDDSLSGGGGNDLVFNGAGDDTVLGDIGDDTLWGGAGDDILKGGAGADTFAFTSTNGSDTVRDFDETEDILLLQGSGFADLEALKEAATETAGGVIISFGDTAILLTGLGIDDLTTENVML